MWGYSRRQMGGDEGRGESRLSRRRKEWAGCRRAGASGGRVEGYLRRDDGEC